VLLVKVEKRPLPLTVLRGRIDQG